MLNRLLNLIGNPNRLFYGLYLKLTKPWIPLECMPSFEHRFLFSSRIKPSLVLDIGFNVGQFSVLCLKYWICPVIAFDPNPYASPKAAAKIQRHFPRRFRFLPIGLGDIPCSLPLNITRAHSNSSFYKPTLLNQAYYPNSKVLSSAEAPVLALSSFSFNSGNNIFLKIDVQGFELNVIKGISDSQFDSIKWIYVELTDLVLYERQANLVTIVNYLESRGYRQISLNNVSRPATDSTQILYCDLLFERD